MNEEFQQSDAIFVPGTVRLLMVILKRGKPCRFSELERETGIAGSKLQMSIKNMLSYGWITRVSHGLYDVQPGFMAKLEASRSGHEKAEMIRAFCKEAGVDIFKYESTTRVEQRIPVVSVNPKPEDFTVALQRLLQLERNKITSLLKSKEALQLQIASIDEQVAKIQSGIDKYSSTLITEN